MDEKNRKTARQPITGERTTKGKILIRIVYEMPTQKAQKTRNATMQRVGFSKTDTSFLHVAADDVAVNTTALRVMTAAKPKRESLTHNNQPNGKLKATPITMKKSQKSHPNKESAVVRRNEKIGSPLRSSLLTTKSAVSVRTKREKPRTKTPVNPGEGEATKAERPITKQITATAKSAFLNDGRENMEE